MSEDYGKVLNNLRRQAERLRNLVDQKRLAIEAAKVSRDISLLNRELAFDTTTKEVTKQIIHQTEFFAPAAVAAPEDYQDRVLREKARAAEQVESSEFVFAPRVQGPTGPDLTPPAPREGYTLEGPYWSPTTQQDVGAKEGDVTYLISDYPEEFGPKPPLVRGFWLLRASSEAAAALRLAFETARELRERRSGL